MKRDLLGWIVRISASALFFIVLVYFIPLDGHAKEKTNPIVKLRILETTDVHGYIMDYDYSEDKHTVDYGLARTAHLIKEARKEVKNSLLFDNGDLIQGSAMAEYISKVKGLKDIEIHPIIKALNLLNYDAATLGNHEFNNGLPFLEKTIKQANFPYVNANVVYPYNNKNRYEPYIILDKKVKDKNGDEEIIKVGVIGFVTTKINEWDKENLQGKAVAKDIVATAEKFVPEMKKEGADIIVALAHTGVYANSEKDEENSVLPLSKVEGIDVILFGHQHIVFPGETNPPLKGFNRKTGKLNGVVAVSAGRWGNHLGMVDLTLEKDNEQWKIKHSKAITKPLAKSIIVFGTTITTPLVDKPYSKMVKAVKKAHEQTLDYMRFVSPR